MQIEETHTTKNLRKASLRKLNKPVEYTFPVARARSTRKKVDPSVGASKAAILENVVGGKEMEDLETQFQEKIGLNCFADKYFSQHSTKSKFSSSKKTLADLGKKRLTAEQASKLVDKLPPVGCMAAIEARIAEIESTTFPRMIGQLRHNYNVLLHGFGSKLRLLDSFVATYLRQENCIVVPAFQSSVSVSQLLSKIADAFAIELQTSSKSSIAVAGAIRDFFNATADDDSALYLAIHNIDGPAIARDLDVLVILAQSAFIRVVASVDHLNSELLWSDHEFHWLWHDCTTCMPYIVETRAGSSRLMAENSAAGLDSLRAVTASLHDNAKQVFLLLAQHQIAENKAAKYDGMPVEALLRQSRDSFFVTNEMALRNLLTEFRDHKLVQSRYGADRSEYVKITLDEHSVREFAANFSSF